LNFSPFNSIANVISQNYQFLFQRYLCHWPKKLDTNSLHALCAHYKELVKRALRSNIGSNALDRRC